MRASASSLLGRAAERPLAIGAGAFVVIAAVAAIGFLLARPEQPNQPSAQVASQAPQLEPVWDGLRKKANTEQPSDAALRDLRDAFRIMRGPPEDVPAGIQRHIRETIGAAPGEFRFEDSQFTPVNGGLWIVSGENVTCVSQRGIGGFACDTTSRFARNGTALGVGIGARGSPGRPREFLVQGAAPDWAEVARLEVNGHDRLIPVKNNTYGLRAKTRVLLERLER